MQSLKISVLLLVITLLTACGGGSGSSSKESPTSISVAPGQIELTAELNALQDSYDSKTIDVNFKGDGVAIGFAPDITAPDWLIIDSGDSNQSPLHVTVMATTANLPEGIYTTTLRFVSGLEDGTQLVKKDVPIKFNVIKRAFSIIGTQEKTITESANTADLAWSLQLQNEYDAKAGAKLHWQISSNQTWLNVSPATGDFSKLQNINVQLDAKQLLNLSNGDLTAALTLSVNNSTQKPLSIPIHIHLDMHPKLEFETDPTFLLDNSSTDAALIKSLKVKSNMGDAFRSVVNWQAESSSDWITLLKKDGNTDKDTELQLQIKKAALVDMPNGINVADINLTANNPRYEVAAIPVSLDLRLSAIEHVAPYVAYTGRSEAIVLRGSGFANQQPFKVNFAGTMVEATTISETEIRINYPNMAAEKSINLTIPNALQLQRSSAHLQVKHPPVYSAKKIAVDMNYSDMTFDAERETILLSGWQSDKLLRLNVNSGQENTVTLPGLIQTTVLDIDGKEILASIGGVDTQDNIVHLDPGTLAINKSVPIKMDIYDAYRLIAPLNDGRIFLLNNDQHQYGILYPSEEELALPNNLYNMQMILSRDRSRMLLGSSDGQYTFIYSYDSKDSVFIHSSISNYFSPQMTSMSSDGGRLVSNTFVYDRDFNELGYLELGRYYSLVAVAPDGKSVYSNSYRYDDQNQQRAFKRHDISSASLHPANSNDLPIGLDADDQPLQMLVSDDGDALFILAKKYNYQTYSFESAAVYIFPLAH